MATARAIFSPYRNDMDIFTFIGKMLQQNEIRFEDRFRLNTIEVFKSTLDVNKENSDRLTSFITKLYDKIAELEKHLASLASKINNTADVKDKALFGKHYRMIKVMLDVIEDNTKKAAVLHDELFPPVLQPLEPVVEEVATPVTTEVEEVYAKPATFDFMETVKSIKLFSRDAISPSGTLVDEIARITATINGSSKEKAAQRSVLQCSRALRVYSSWEIQDGSKSPGVESYLGDLNSAINFISKKVQSSRNTASTFAIGCYKEIQSVLEHEGIYVIEAADLVAKAFKTKNLFTLAWLFTRFHARGTDRIEETTSVMRQIRSRFEERADLVEMGEIIRMREAFEDSQYFKDTMGATIKSKDVSLMNDLKGYAVIKSRLEEVWPLENMQRMFAMRTEKAQDRDTQIELVASSRSVTMVVDVGGKSVFEEDEIAEIIGHLPSFKDAPLLPVNLVVSKVLSLVKSKKPKTKNEVRIAYGEVSGLFARECMKVNFLNFTRGPDAKATKVLESLDAVRDALEKLEYSHLNSLILDTIDSYYLNISSNRIPTEKGLLLYAGIYMHSVFASAATNQDIPTAYCVLVSELRNYIHEKRDPELLRKLIKDRQAVDFTTPQDQRAMNLHKRHEAVWSYEKMNKDVETFVDERMTKEQPAPKPVVAAPVAAPVIEQPIQKETKEVSKETTQNKREIVNLAFQEYMNSSTTVYNFLESLSVRNAEKFDEHLETLTTSAAKLMPHLRVEIVGEEKVSDQLRANFVMLANRCVDLYRDYPNSSVSNLIGIIAAFEKTIEVMLALPEPVAPEPQITKGQIETSIIDLELVIDELYKAKHRLQDIAK